MVQGRVPTFFGPPRRCSRRWRQIFLLGIDSLAFASSSLFLSAAWLFSKEKSIVTVAFSIGLRLGSTTACVVQIRRRSLQDFILNDDDAYSTCTCKSPRRAGYSERGACDIRTSELPHVIDHYLSTPLL